MKPKSQIVSNLDFVQAELGKLVKPLGFSRKGRTFRRATELGVLQIIALQAGPFEIGPPLPEPFGYLREDYYGKFTINLGVYVEEIYERSNPPLKPGRVISDAHCTIRTRLAHIAEGADRWWSLREDLGYIIEEISSSLISVGIPYLDRFKTRDKIIHGIDDYDKTASVSYLTRIDIAMILLKRGDRRGAIDMFQQHLKGSEGERDIPHVRNHRTYVMQLAQRLGLGPLL